MYLLVLRIDGCVESMMLPMLMVVAYIMSVVVAPIDGLIQFNSVRSVTQCNLGALYVHCNTDPNV